MENEEVINLLKQCDITIDINDIVEISEDESNIIIPVNGNVTITKDVLHLIKWYKEKEKQPSPVRPTKREQS
jgi:hypothetical protein